MRKCFGYARAVGRVKVPRFAVPWWWRTDFTARPRAGRDAKLIINGVIGAANVWVNGRKLAGAATVTGAYARFTFDITRLLRPRRNSLAIEVRPNNPLKMFTLDDVDWNQIPPDNNTGIQFPVQLQLAGPLADGNAHVIERNAAGLASSALTVKADITNSASRPQTGTVTATITPPAGGAAGHGQPAGDRAAAHHPDGHPAPGPVPRADHPQAAHLVAVPARRASPSTRSRRQSHRAAPR